MTLNTNMALDMFAAQSDIERELPNMRLALERKTRLLGLARETHKLDGLSDEDRANIESVRDMLVADCKKTKLSIEKVETIAEGRGEVFITKRDAARAELQAVEVLVRSGTLDAKEAVERHQRLIVASAAVAHFDNFIAAGATYVPSYVGAALNQANETAMAQARKRAGAVRNSILLRTPEWEYAFTTAYSRPKNMLPPPELGPAVGFFMMATKEILDGNDLNKDEKTEMLALAFENVRRARVGG
jgi:hypothetical protein